MWEIIQNLTQKAINTIFEINRKDFPALLREIDDPPERLFVRGNLDECEDAKKESKYLCVVGSRKASQYGIDACRKLIAGLAGSDIIIVSGLAIGIDGIAHEAALKAGLKTIAVLASGLNWDSIYPRSHEKLAKEIVASGGALVSEFGSDYTPRKYNFPERNRIMAGLSDAVMIVEAAPASGSLITTKLAAEYNRDVFAVPSSIFSKLAEGPNRLISNGAMLIHNSDDILFGLNLPAGEIKKSQPLLQCNDIENKIFEMLQTPMARPELLYRLDRDHGVTTSETNVALSLLEIKGLIVESGSELRRI